MSKKTAPRDLADNEAQAFAATIRTSPRKLNLVAQSIRGLKAEAALAQLTFSRRRIAQDVKKVLQSAIANAENNHQLDVDRLVVAEAFVGKAMVMKRFSARARGRVGHIVKPFSNLTVIVREREESVGEEKA
ncbi:50S ribosomal protein L22 [Telmatospirillum siberiense]|uniref:Large ribosomal subunit protein uL22 n=1 Tax=Telmatospirillum siberiense TaxID=382514 RepID=A0A2N3PN76_9PROT|nr:50S ribosomal protein L22 [Telmatospirillum siberiense]PKU21855.1 50S ribosomal protein L22 [Telmatospirillum siberiense]